MRLWILGEKGGRRDVPIILPELICLTAAGFSRLPLLLRSRTGTLAFWLYEEAENAELGESSFDGRTKWACVANKPRPREAPMREGRKRGRRRRLAIVIGVA